MGSNLRGMYVASSAQLGAGMALAAPVQAFASNEVTFSGLSGNYNYRLILQITSNAAGGANIELNGDTTATNYYTQYLSFTGAAVSTGVVNANSCLHTENGGGYWTIDIGIDNSSHPCFHTKGNVSIAAAIVQEYFGARTASASTEITSIKVIQSGGVTITGNAKLYRIYNV